jgi:phosphoenolpyruvate synthase/pyruvate phosphate dikinase
VAILQELEKQKIVEKYVEMKEHWAFLAAVFMNGLNGIAGMFSKKRPKQVKPDDFISKDFEKIIKGIIKEAQPEKDWASHIQDAKAKGLKGPW